MSGKKVSSFIFTYKMHSVFFRSLALIVGFSFILTVLFYIFIIRLMEKNYRENMEAASKNALDQIVSTMEFTRDYAQSTLYQLITNRDIVRAIIVPDMTDNSRNFRVANILHTIVDKNDLFRQVYLYIRGNDSVLSSDSRRAYLRDFWEPSLITPYLGGGLKGYQLDAESSIIRLGGRIFLAVDFFFSVPNHNGVCFAELDPAILLQTVYQNPTINPVYIYDAGGEPLFPSELQYPARNIKELVGDFQEERPAGAEMIEGSRLFYRFSRKTGWHFLYQVANSHFEAPRFQLLFGVLPVIFSILFVGILLSLYVARGIYTPMQRLLHLITSNADYLSVHKSDTVRNEYDFLTFAFQEASQFRGKLSDLIDTVRPAVMEKLLAGLLSEKEESPEQAASTLKNIQSPFHPEDLYGVLVFSLPDKSGELINLEQDIAFLTVRRQFQSFASQSDAYAFVQMDKTTLAAVLRYEKDLPVLRAKQQTLALMNRITQDTKPLVPSLLVGGGKTYAGLMDVGRLYREAQEDIRYQSYFGAAFDNADEEAKDSMQFQFYLSGRMSQVSSEISQNKPGEAEKILVNLLDEIDAASDQEKRTARFDQFLSSLTTMMLSFGIPVQEAVSLETGEKPAKPDNEAAYHDYLVHVCRRGITLLADYQRRYQHRHIVRAKEYIAEHYSDNTMGLERVAEYTGIKASYLSTLFNEKIGEHFVDYLNKYRIEKAKELLRMTQTTIKEIGHITGFYSDHTFIRVFKKHENCTPGQYRDRIQHGQREQSPKGEPVSFLK
ncbi:MAG: AraC family transcriptional regulator [Spirochaetales bacterium]|nr:AraC family transcriptional regulator [Spirochaetales bacterium]